MANLDPNGDDVQVDEIVIRTPGLEGRVETQRVPPGEVRASNAPPLPETLAAALQASDVHAERDIVINQAFEVPLPPGGGRDGTPQERQIEVEVPRPPAEHGQVVLYQDESGAVSWGFQVPEENEETAVRAAGRRLYRIRQPRQRSETSEDSENRLAGALLTKAIKVFDFPLVDKVVGAVGDYFVGRWENAKRPHRVRWFGPETYTERATSGLTPDEWLSMKSKPVLLMIHGTFSQCHSGMEGFPRQFVADLAARYEGRVIGFDHPTVSATPTENAEYFISQVPPGAEMQFDVICHSRGGLVSRELAEKLSPANPKIQIRRVIFVGTPNNGTRLADFDHFDRLIDTYTNILTWVPAPASVEVLETVLVVVKQLAVKLLKGLEGLSSMVPGGEYLTELNGGTARGDTRYFALTSNFESTEKSALLYLRDILMDEIFDVDNDLIVPTSGVFEANGSPMFPITDVLSYPPKDGIQHSGFFSNAAANEQIMNWLTMA